MSGAANQELLSPRLERVTVLIASGRFDQGARLARSLTQEFPKEAPLEADRKAVEWLASLQLPRATPEAWAEAWESRPAAGTPAIDAAIKASLARGLVRASDERDGSGAFLGEEPVGLYLLQADLPQDAAASLFASLAKAPKSGRAALHLGNALFHLERPAEARDGYRRALRVAPGEVSLEEIVDAEVRELASHQEELGLKGDVRPWIPAIGYLEDVLPLSALDPVPGSGFGDGTRAYDLLIAHKGARSHGERLAIRRDLQLLAPILFASLVEARKLDGAAPPVGNA